MNDGLKDRHRDAIIALLAANDRVEKAVLFGSRAMETGTDTSDVDIALFGDRLSLTDQARLAAAIEEIPMAQSVDLVLHRAIDHQPLLDHIRTHGIEWYRRPENKADPRLHLRPKHRRMLEDLLREHLPDVEVWAYGSRVNGRSHDGSDLDLVLRGPGLKEIPASRLTDFEEAVRESTIPFPVEARDWTRLPERFCREIEREYVVLVGTDGLRSSGSQWAVATIEDISEKVAMGPFGSSIKVETFVPNGIPIISGQHLRGSRVDDTPGFNFITSEHAERLANANVFRGDIVFTHAGNIGQSAYIPKNSRYSRYVISQRQFYLRCNRSKALPEFVTLFFKSPEGQHKLLANSSQVGVPSIAKPVSYLRTIEIPLPPLPEQRAIAHILGTLDDKIELNRQMNETLEAISRAIFKDWFVDFGPVRAKMEGRLPYLPSDMWDMFPGQLADFELGKIPDGWQVRKLDKIATVTKGCSYRRADLGPSKIALVTLKSFSRGGGYQSKGLKPFKGKYKSDQMVLPGDVIVACTDVTQAGEVIGRSALVEKSSNHSILVASLDVLVLRPISARVDRMFLYHLTRTHGFAVHNLARSTGTTVLHLAKEAVPSYRFALPSSDLINSFERIARVIWQRRSKNLRETETLTQTRDLLLPKLMSGEIRIRDAENMVEAVT